MEARLLERREGGCTNQGRGGIRIGGRVDAGEDAGEDGARMGRVATGEEERV